ncbi:unnamed protein product, partial [Rotaria sp. Silwood2]
KKIKISFKQANIVILKSAYLNWYKETEKIRLSRYINNDKYDRSANEIIEQMIEQQNNSTNVILTEILRKIAEETEIFREEAKEINIRKGDEKSYIKYIRSHLNEITPLILYTWSIANKPQFPNDNQIIALLFFIYSYEKGLIEQVRTGEGRTLIVGFTVAFFALCGNAVDIVSTNRNLAIEGEKKCRSIIMSSVELRQSIIICDILTVATGGVL